MAINKGDRRGLSGRRNIVVSISAVSTLDNKNVDDKDDDDGGIINGDTERDNEDPVAWTW